MKRIKLIIISFSILLFFSIITSSVVEAAIYPGGRKNDAKQYAFYHSNVGIYAQHYDSGRAYWNSHSKVNIKKTNSTNNRPDMYYIGITSIPNFYGQVIPYNSQGNIVSAGSYWDYVGVHMYSNQMKADGPKINYNAAHEIGHSIKMGHENIPTNSVMVQGWRNIPSSLTPYYSSQVNLKW